MWKLVLAETCHNVAWEHEPKSPRGHIIPYKKDGNHGWQPWKLKLHKLKGITSHFASWCREMTSNLNQMKSKRDDSSHWFRIRVTENGTRLDPKVVLLNLCILDPNSTGQNKKNCIVMAHYANLRTMFNALHMKEKIQLVWQMPKLCKPKVEFELEVKQEVGRHLISETKRKKTRSGSDDKSWNQDQRHQPHWQASKCLTIRKQKPP